MSNTNGPMRVAIACQGGGSHTAFTAGALKPLLRHAGADSYEIVGLSGTSGGAICAFLAWFGLVKSNTQGWNQEQTIALLDTFWRDNTAKLPWEKLWNDWVLSLLELEGQGTLPSFKTSPYSAPMLWTAQLLETIAPRPEFMNLRRLLEAHVNLNEVQQPVTTPRLLLGAVEVLSGTFKAFDSSQSEITIDAVLASTTLPTLFRSIAIGEGFYWDGLFSQNPPIREFLHGIDVDDKPDEIWVIRINPQEREREPRTVEEIEDRRNELAGNLSLNQELDFIKLVNKWLETGILQAPNKKPIAVREITMSPEKSVGLGISSKLNRSPEFILGLMEDGAARATRFLEQELQPLKVLVAGGG